MHQASCPSQGHDVSNLRPTSHHRADSTQTKTAAWGQCQLGEGTLQGQTWVGAGSKSGPLVVEATWLLGKLFLKKTCHPSEASRHHT